jgi:hypothetical protein
VWTNRLKPYHILSGEDVEAIHEQWPELLAKRKREIGDD